MTDREAQAVATLQRGYEAEKGKVVRCSSYLDPAEALQAAGLSE